MLKIDMSIDPNNVISLLRSFVRNYRIQRESSAERQFTNTQIDQSLEKGKKPSKFLFEMFGESTSPLAYAACNQTGIEHKLFELFQHGSRGNCATVNHSKVIEALNALEKQGASEDLQRLLIVLLQEQFSNSVFAFHTREETIDSTITQVPVPSKEFSREEIIYHTQRLLNLEKEIPELVRRIGKEPLD